MRGRKKISKVNERQEDDQKVKEMQGEEKKVKDRQTEIKKNVTKETKIKPCQYIKINTNDCKGGIFY